MRGAGEKARRAVLAGSITGFFETATLAGAVPRAWPCMFLRVCASDAQGLSYYSDSRIAELLGLEPAILRSCRRELIGLGLIAYQKTALSAFELGRGAPGARKRR